MGLGDLLKSEAAQELLDKGLDLVKEHATEEGIEALIKKCKEMGLTENETVAKLIDKFDYGKPSVRRFPTMDFYCGWRKAVPVKRAPGRLLLEKIFYFSVKE